MTENIQPVDLFQELLSSDRLGAFQGWNNQIVQRLGDDPGILWDRIMWDPWTAMAIFEDMERKDSTLFSTLGKRRDGVLALDRQVKPASDSRQDRKVAGFVEETLETFWGGGNTFLNQDSYSTPFESFLDEALEAVGNGVTIGEIIFAEASDRIYINEVKFKPQHLFSFGDTALASYSTSLMAYPQTGRLRLRSGVLVEGYGMGEALPENKFFVFSYRIRKSNRWGSPLKVFVFWPAWMKRNGVKAWLKYLEKGAGTVVSRYNDGSDQAEQQNAIDAAVAVVEQSAVGIPKKFLLEVLESVRNIGTSHKEFVDDYCNAEISRAIVGQTLTGRGSDGGGSRALGEVHERVESKKVETDAKQLMAAVNQRIIPAIVVPNFGPNTACPLWVLDYEPGEDVNTAAKRYGVIRKEIGLPLSKKHVYEKLQEPEPIDEEDTLMPAPDPAALPQDDPLNDSVITELSEKKKIALSSGTRANSRTGRFRRFRPSMIEFSDE
jgi:phage gp29-like protein